VGFVHGVMNTDNMSILGLTIDYGPYGWLESFDPDWTPNTTDAGTRRYRYGAQPQIAHWNLLQLANAIAPLVDDPEEALNVGLERYVRGYHDGFHAMLAERLGWGAWRDDDGVLVDELFAALRRTEVDQVLFFRDLAMVSVDDPSVEPLAEAFYEPPSPELVAWLRAWGARVREGGLDDEERRRRMDAVNPRFVLRNYLAQEAIDAAEQGDPSLVHDLLDVLRRPYDDQPGRERFAARRPEWARSRVGCSMLSCSS
jgi:protein adenylyltransferase